MSSFSSPTDRLDLPARHSSQELLSRLDDLERREAMSAGHRHRRTARFRFEDLMHCAVSYGQEIAADVMHQVVARNVSDDGLAVLQAREVPIGAPVRVRLRMVDDQTSVIDGQVRRCLKLTNQIFDVGIEFDRRVVAREIMISEP